MIAAATAAASPSGGGLAFNWFDIVVVAVLGFGFYRGRRNGMSRELLPLLFWVVLVAGCALIYPVIAGFLNSFVLDPFWGCLLAYLAPAALVFMVFRILKHFLAERLVKSDFFKGGEYYLGMVSGVVRYACAIVFVLALLNAPFYSQAQKNQMKAYDEKNFGGGLFSGNYFPHIYQVQDSVFEHSFLGPLVKNYAGALLINTGQAAAAKNAAAKNNPSKPANPAKPAPLIQIGTNIFRGH